MKIPLRAWNEFFLENKVEKSKRIGYIKYINKLNYKELPVVFEHKHLSVILGIKYPVFQKMINSPESFYYSFKIQKRKGGFREINAPYPLMRYVQQWILTQILQKITLHKNAFAYREGVSIVDNAKRHLGNNFLLKVDLKDFFPSIEKKRVIAIFQNLGYTNKLSYFLATLCCYKGVLPQGACTSPHISNIILKGLDVTLTDLSNKRQICYSRYADDMTFSGKVLSKKFIDEIRPLINAKGFSLNDDKTLFLTKEKKQIVTGVAINNNKLRLPKSKRRILKQEYYYISKYGLETHLKNRGIEDPIYLARLIGKFQFWLQIEPKNAFVLNALQHLQKLRDELM